VQKYFSINNKQNKVIPLFYKLKLGGGGGGGTGEKNKKKKENGVCG
jgi:uncharacterized spore protein YtfJ